MAFLARVNFLATSLATGGHFERTEEVLSWGRGGRYAEISIGDRRWQPPLGGVLQL